MNRLVLLSLTALALVVVGCSATSHSPYPAAQTAFPIETEERTVARIAATSEPTITVPPGDVSATLVSRTTGVVIPGTIAYLVHGVGEQGQVPIVLSGADSDLGDKVATSDESGRVEFRGVAPGVYYLAVWAPYDWRLILDDGSDMPRRLELVEGAGIDLGRVELYWP